MKSLLLAILCIFAVFSIAGLACAHVEIGGSLTREATVLPGDKIEGKIVLQNNGDQSSRVKVYQADYRYSAEGTSTYPDSGSSDRSNASWVTFAPQEINIPAGASTDIYYVVLVPEGDRYFGTYWSTVLVETISVGGRSLETPERVGVKIVTNIGETGTTDVRFSNGRISGEPGKTKACFDLENTGERGISPMLWAEIFDESGLSQGRIEGDKMCLYPGCSGRFSLDLTRLAKGDYSALVAADNGDGRVFSVQYKFRIQ